MVGMKGGSKGTRRRDVFLWGQQHYGRKVVIGTHLAKGSHKGSSTVLFITRGVQTRSYNPPEQVGMSALPERWSGLEDSPGTHATA
jgi:hypothetical protein